MSNSTNIIINIWFMKALNNTWKKTTLRHAYLLKCHVCCTVGVSQNGRSFLPPPRPPDQFLKLFFSLPYFLLSWKYVQEVMLLWVYCVPHNVHLYKIGKFQFRKFYEFFLVPFFNNEKEAKTLIKRDKGMAVWYQGVGLQWFLPKNCKK